jgi:hypothetical protein
LGGSGVFWGNRGAADERKHRTARTEMLRLILNQNF